MGVQSQDGPTDIPGRVPTSRKRTRMVRPYPIHTLEEAVAVATTIQEVNAGLPFDRVLLAKAMGTTPVSSGFTTKLNSSTRYGLTQGGYNDDYVVLTPRGASVVAPQQSSERHQALVDAAMQPELFRRFFQMLDDKRIPEDAYAQNMLQRELGVNTSLTAECLNIIKANGRHVGILDEVDGSLHVSLSGARLQDEGADASIHPAPAETKAAQPAQEPDSQAVAEDRPDRGGRIYIGHAGTPDVVDFIKTVLDEFDIPYGAAESDYDDQRPVAADASKEMRDCDAAILVFATPSWTRVSGGREVPTTDMMLYQMGAASVLYGERIVSLKEKGLQTDDPDTGFHTVEFQRDRLEDIALVLLAELHRLGVIEVRARAQTEDNPPAD